MKASKDNRTPSQPLGLIGVLMRQAVRLVREQHLRHRALIVTAVIISALWFRVPGIERAMFRDWVDDSFFYVLIADGIVGGRGSTSDGIGLTNGYHPLWMWLHVAIRWALEDPLPALAVAQFLILAAALLMLYQYVRAYAGATAALMLSLVAVFESTFMRVLGAGMETGLAFTALLTTLCLVRLRPLRHLSQAEHMGVQAALLFLFLARLDGGLFWVALAVAGLFHGGTTGYAALRLRAWEVTRLFAAPAVMACAYLVFNRWRFGIAMPISGRIKSLKAEQIAQEGLASYLGAAWDRLVVLFAPNGWPLPGGLSPYAPRVGSLSRGFWPLYLLLVAVVLVLLFRALQRRRQLDRSMMTLLIFAGLHTLYYTFLQSDRYLLSWAHGPELLLLGLALTWLLAMMARKVWTAAARHQAAWVLTAVLFAALLQVSRDRALHPGTIRDFRSSVRDFRNAVAYIRAHTPGDERIASESIGFLGHYSDRRIVSLDGLLNSTDYYHDYLTQGEVGRYLREHDVTMIAQSLRRDVDAISYMADVIGVERSSLSVEAEFAAVPHAPRRYLIFRLESGAADSMEAGAALR